MRATFAPPTWRVLSGVKRGALLAGWLCLAVACGDRRALLGADGAADTRDASDAGMLDGAAESVTPPPVDGSPDTSGVQDARDASPDAPDVGLPDAVADVTPPPVDGPPDTSGVPDARDASPDGSPDVMDASVEVRPDTGPPGCPVDCSRLPHIRPGLVINCNTTTGVCVVPTYACEAGFAHCSSNPNDGCETDLSKPTSCGMCNNNCYAPNSVCSAHNGSYNCGPVCTAPLSTCFYSCVDYQSDPNNCGGCGRSCYLPNAVTGCAQGQCTVVSCSDPSYANCTSEPGCETPLGTENNCAACGDKACTLANTLPTCSSANSCASAVCAVGFGNCDVTRPDCEASFTAGGTCFPAYRGTTPLATQTLNDAALVIGTDGSYFLAGGFSGTVDFDPTAAQDIRAPSAPDDTDGFITKFNADGSYAWTRTFAGRGYMSVRGLAAAAAGAVVAVGSYADSVDLDPGSAAVLQQTATPFQQDALVVKLAADGTFAWGRTFQGTDASAFIDAASVAVDAADAVYLAGSYQGRVDFDSGVGTSLSNSSQQTGMLVKVTAAGALAWVQSIQNAACVSYLSAVAVGTDGVVWGVGAAGAGAGCTLPLPDPMSNSTEGLIVAYNDAGVSRGLWTLGGGVWQEVMAASVSAGANGAIYVGGAASAGLVDFDPGPGEAKRWVGADGFILKLGANAAFSWVQTVSGIPVISVAAASDGGVLGAGSSAGGFVTKLNTDGTAAWTFASGPSGTNARAVAARGTSFALAGISSGSGDFNPGNAIDIVFGDIIFMSRFSF